MSGTQQATIDDVPADVLAIVAGKLIDKDLGRLAKTSKRMNAIVNGHPDLRGSFSDAERQRVKEEIDHIYRVMGSTKSPTDKVLKRLRGIRAKLLAYQKKISEDDGTLSRMLYTAKKKKLLIKFKFAGKIILKHQKVLELCLAKCQANMASIRKLKPLDGDANELLSSYLDLDETIKTNLAQVEILLQQIAAASKSFKKTYTKLIATNGS